MMRCDECVWDVSKEHRSSVEWKVKWKTGPGVACKSNQKNSWQRDKDNWDIAHM